MYLTLSAPRLLDNLTIATMRQGEKPYGLIEHGAIAIEAGRIAWVGGADEVPESYSQIDPVDFDGRLITPALIDCHTHLVFAGNRAAEFEQRLLGVSYAEISRAGGGIRSTVAATRAASEDALVVGALNRLDALIADGVGTVEVKSGYGLDLETELRMLRVARRLAEERSIQVKTSFLGAHAIPPEFEGRADAYIDLVCNEMIPAVADEGLADAVDGFCESIAFSPDQIERVFQAAAAHDLPVKLHAEQLSNLGGAALAARYGAISADHLEYLDGDGVTAMTQSGTAAVLLPGAFYTLGETQHPPIDALRASNVPMAVATDCNPGSSPLVSPLLAMNMACTLFGLTPEEALTGMTRNAAKALGMAEGAGTIAPGAPADLAVWNVESPAELAYIIGHRPLHQRIVEGNDA